MQAHGSPPLFPSQVKDNHQLRILVLTAGTGGGHDARASAVAAWCRKLYPDGVALRIARPLESASRITHFGVGLYNVIQKWAPLLHHPYWWFVEGLGYLQRKRVTLGKRYYESLLKEFTPHLILSVHDFLNRGYFQTAKSILGHRVRCSTYCGEFSGGFGYSRNWVEPTADLFFSRTSMAQDYAIRMGISPQKCRVRGHLMHPKVYDQVLDDGERRNFLVDELGLSQDKFTLLLAASGMGANNHLKLLQILKEYSSNVQAIAVCGRDGNTAKKILEWKKGIPDFKVHVEGYSIRMHHLIQVSDAVVSRGATTCAEALFFEVPIIFNGLGGMMPQERLTYNYFYRSGAAVKMSNPEDLDYHLGLWLTHEPAYARLRERCRDIAVMEDPTLLIRELHGLAAEAMQESP